MQEEYVVTGFKTRKVFRFAHIRKTNSLKSIREPRMRHQFFCTNSFYLTKDLIFVYSMGTTKRYFLSSGIA